MSVPRGSYCPGPRSDPIKSRGRLPERNKEDSVEFHLLTLMGRSVGLLRGRGPCLGRVSGGLLFVSGRHVEAEVPGEGPESKRRPLRVRSGDGTDLGGDRTSPDLSLWSTPAGNFGTLCSAEDEGPSGPTAPDSGICPVPQARSHRGKQLPERTEKRYRHPTLPPPSTPPLFLLRSRGVPRSYRPGGSSGAGKWPTPRAGSRRPAPDPSPVRRTPPRTARPGLSHPRPEWSSALHGSRARA